MPGIRIGASARLPKQLLPNARNTWWVVVSPLGPAYHSERNTFEDFVDERGRAIIHIRKVDSIRNKASLLEELAA
jgi:hypothetical protein